MANNIIVVTPPDDILSEAKRILLFDPTLAQTQLISQSLNDLDLNTTVIFYIWRFGDDLNWLLDKFLKYDVAILNAETQEQGLLGYLFAKQHTYYLGQIRSLDKIKKSAIYDIDHLNNILKERMNARE